MCTCGCVFEHFTMSALYGHIFLTGLLFYLFPVGECTRVVYGYLGHSVTLPCRYDAGYYGGLHMCWGRGYIPNSGCNNEIISTDGNKVTGRKLDRYNLLGRMKAGDVSLTIRNTVGSDAGIYGCRVHIPGWFNDQKDTVHLILTTAPTTTQTPGTTERETTPSTTTAPVTTTQIPATTNQERTSSPTQGPVITTEGPLSSPLPTGAKTTRTTQNTPVPSDWPTDAEAIGKLATDTSTQVLSHAGQSTPVTTEATPLSYWLTNPGTKQKGTDNIHAQGDWEHLTARPTLGQTSESSIPLAEKAQMLRPHLLWILVPALPLVAVLVTAIVFRMRQQHKTGYFHVGSTGEVRGCTTPDPTLELETRKPEMKDMVTLQEGENAERCP
ncbi:hepatitis A virus cellular receptor 1 homolog isoform X7 [Anguilla anguilla]|uniref:hepatitis A virus cellular receptor 1 homolog isoform X6 n=1 Tax=Anguilla anguilla TaxID=7936 RepID=UPI0015ABAA16|nr:hepatitis A virus cellular receptor 1 homolog isoform X6 [Anguilla anguilla]XP_035265648.1 hepatitis A virus cellular receptor 1 homolog isoform X7 [Anguilla anguilla]